MTPGETRLDRLGAYLRAVVQVGTRLIHLFKQGSTRA